MRKIVLSLVLVLVLCTTTFAVSPIEQARAWTEAVGLPIEFLESAYDDLILQIYNDNKSAHHIEFEIIAKYGTEAFDPNLLTEVPTDAPDLWCVSAKASSVEGYVEYVNVYVYYVWDVDFAEKELIGSRDAVRLTWDSSVWTRTTNSIFTTELIGAKTNSVYHTSTRPATSGQGFAEWGVPIESVRGTPYGSAKIQLLPVDTQMKTDTEYTSPFDAFYEHETVAETPVRSRYTAAYKNFLYAIILTVSVIRICIRRQKTN